MSVLRAGKDWEVLAVNNLEEDVYATPALAGDRIYLRTSGYLYCFAVHDLVRAVRDGDLDRARTLLAPADVPNKTLNFALIEATAAKNSGLMTLLRKAGAASAQSDQQPVIPERRLAAYAGHFQTEKGWKAEIVLEDGVLIYKGWGSESRLEPMSSTSFNIPERVAIMLEFEIDGERILGFTYKHPDWPAASYKRVEAKQSE